MLHRNFEDLFININYENLLCFAYFRILTEGIIKLNFIDQFRIVFLHIENNPANLSIEKLNAVSIKQRTLQVNSVILDMNINYKNIFYLYLNKTIKF